MKKTRSTSNRDAVEYTATDLLDQPEDELDFVQLDWAPDPAFSNVPTVESDLDDLRCRLRLMIEQLENEADQIRRQLRALEATTPSNVYH
jgi:hypothetical protein